MTKDLQQNELSREQILDLADAQGRKLGFLLATSPLDNETKDSLLGIIEKATQEQLDVIYNFFDEEYLMAQNQDLNEWFKGELEDIKTEFDKEQEELDKNTVEKMDNLIKSIK